MSVVRRWLAAIPVALCLGAGSAWAASPGPAAPSDVPEPPAADCTGLVARLPVDLGEGLTLEAVPTTGIEGIDPDDLLDPFLASMALDRDDVCGVSIRYGASPTDLIGLLVRVRGAGPGLAVRLAGALADRLRAYGDEVTEETSQVAGAAAPLLRVNASGIETLLVVVDVLDDTVLIGASSELPDALLPLASSMAPVWSPTVPAPPSEPSAP